MANEFVEMYKHYVKEGYEHSMVFAEIASLIAIIGTIEDLRQVRKVYQKDMDKKWEEIFIEQSTTAV